MKSCSCYPLSRWIRWQFLRWISCVPWWQESQEVLFFCVVSLRSVLHLCETGFWFHLILSFFSASQLTTFHKSHEMLSFAVAASAKMQKFDIALYVYVMFLAVAAMCRIGSMSLVAAPQLYWCFFLTWKKNEKKRHWNLLRPWSQFSTLAPGVMSWPISKVGYKTRLDYLPSLFPHITRQN